MVNQLIQAADQNNVRKNYYHHGNQVAYMCWLPDCHTSGYKVTCYNSKAASSVCVCVSVCEVSSPCWLWPLAQAEGGADWGSW